MRGGLCHADADADAGRGAAPTTMPMLGQGARFRCTWSHKPQSGHETAITVKTSALARMLPRLVIVLAHYSWWR